MIDQESRRLEFGKGDIGIYMGDTAGVALLMFRNLERPAPIGSMPRGKKIRMVEVQPTDVVMTFSNVESIDAIIMCLKAIKVRTFK